MSSQEKLYLHLQKYYNIIEAIPFVLILVSLVMRPDDQDTAIFFIQMPLVLLAILYFISAYAPDPHAPSWLSLMMPKTLGIGLTIALVGIALAIDIHPLADRLLAIGSITIAFSLLLGIIESLRTSFNVIGLRGYVRGLGFGVVAVWLLFFS